MSVNNDTVFLNSVLNDEAKNCSESEQRTDQIWRTSSDGIRGVGPAFDEYRADRLISNKPVYIVVGRGSLVGRVRLAFLKTNIHEEYKNQGDLYTVDIDESTKPNALINVTKPDEMSYFDNDSADGVYLEYLYGSNALTNQNTYNELYRILKPGALLKLDLIGSSEKKAQEKMEAAGFFCVEKTKSSAPRYTLLKLDYASDDLMPTIPWSKLNPT